MPDNASVPSDGDVVPVPVTTLDLADPTPVPVNGEGAGLVLVRLHGVPLGVVHPRDVTSMDAEQAVRWATDHLAGPVAEHLALDGLGPEELEAGLALPAADCAAAAATVGRPVSVVICTLGQDERLVRTVRSVLDQTYRPLEVVVVDNQPATGAVRAMLAGVADERLRVVSEPCRGLSAARNAGVRAATGGVVAFTDDDAHADREWIARLVAPYRHPGVVATTGLVLPAELATRAQLLFEEFGAFDKGLRRTVWAMGNRDLAAIGPRGDGGALFPYSAGVYGSGNNMSFDRRWLVGSGQFDEALGAGSLTRGGEDLDAFCTVLLTGGVLVYEPAAIVWHSARRDLDALRSQLRGYGSGLSAMLTKQLIGGPRAALGIVRRVPAGLVRLLAPGSEKNAGRSAGYPAELSRVELRGVLAGPVLYVRGRREARRRRAAAPLAAADAPSAR